MALQNEILTGRHNNFLRKLFGMKGRSPAPQLSSEISIGQPLFHGAENRFIESWSIYGGVGQQAAAAALNSRVQFRNPASSGILVVIEALSLQGAGPMAFQFGQGPTTELASGALATRSRDGRQASTGQLRISVGTINLGQIGTTIFQTFANPSLFPNADDNQEIVLAPGDSLVIQDGTQNDTLNFGVLWRERPIEPSELQ